MPHSVVYTVSLLQPMAIIRWVSNAGAGVGKSNISARLAFLSDFAGLISRILALVSSLYTQPEVDARCQMPDVCDARAHVHSQIEPRCSLCTVALTCSHWILTTSMFRLLRSFACVQESSSELVRSAIMIAVYLDQN